MALGSHSLAVFLSLTHLSTVHSSRSSLESCQFFSRSHWYCFLSWSLPPSHSLFFGFSDVEALNESVQFLSRSLPPLQGLLLQPYSVNNTPTSSIESALSLANLLSRLRLAEPRHRPPALARLSVVIVPSPLVRVLLEPRNTTFLGAVCCVRHQHSLLCLLTTTFLCNHANSVQTCRSSST